MRKRYRKDVSFDFPLVQCNLGVLCRKKSYPELYLALIGVYYIFLWSTKKFRHNILSFINEARLIRTADLSPDCGALFSPESKGHKDRLVSLPAGLAGICCRYREHLERTFPGSEYFFPCQKYGGRHYGAGWLIDVFRQCWEDAGIDAANGCPPRPYDFRHTFATHRLYQWMADGKDLSVCIPYLSAYMGHADFSATAYYIHLIPEFFFAMSGMDRNRFGCLIPEVAHED